jgi:hypothetical protein
MRAIGFVARTENDLDGCLTQSAFETLHVGGTATVSLTLGETIPYVVIIWAHQTKTSLKMRSALKL